MAAVGGSTLVLGSGLTGPLASRASGQTAAKAGAKSMTEWMDAWTGVKAKDVNGGLYVFRFADPTWVLTRPITWSPNAGQGKYKPVTVPTGFVTDFASIPRAFYTMLRPDGNYSYAAVFHDYLYWTQERPREEADEILRLAMQEFSIDATTVLAIYEAVRTFGERAWNGNVRLKQSGEKRILVKLPDKPTTTWKDWKAQPGVYAG